MNVNSINHENNSVKWELKPNRIFTSFFFSSHAGENVTATWSENVIEIVTASGPNGHPSVESAMWNLRWNRGTFPRRGCFPRRKSKLALHPPRHRRFPTRPHRRRHHRYRPFRLPSPASAVDIITRITSRLQGSLAWPPLPSTQPRFTSTLAERSTPVRWKRWQSKLC